MTAKIPEGTMRCLVCGETIVGDELDHFNQEHRDRVLQVEERVKGRWVEA